MNNKFIETSQLNIISEKDPKDYPLDLKNFSGDRTNIISACIHNYSDGEGLRIDNVGSNAILCLKNAHNPVNRPDKDKKFIGDGSFLKFTESYWDNDTERTKAVFEMNKLGEMFFNRKIHLQTLKNDDNIWGIVQNVQNSHHYVSTLLNGNDFVYKILKNKSQNKYNFIMPSNTSIEYEKGIPEFINNTPEKDTWGFIFKNKQIKDFPFAILNGDDFYIVARKNSLTLNAGINLKPVSPSSITTNLTLFVDMDNKLKFKDINGHIKLVKVE